MKSQPVVKRAGSVPLEAVGAGEGAARQVLIGPEEAPHFALRRFVMQPGGGMPRHTNTVEHEQYVLRGAAEVGIGERRYEVEAGDALYIPRGAPHWYRAKEGEPFEFLCIVPNEPDEIKVLDT